jgi:YesN/AraC family two-component response regulator
MGQLLLVDSEPEIRHALTPHLGSRHEMFHITHGAHALARLRERPVDLAILEYRLPDLSGLELLARIKRTLPRLPVVMATAFGSERVCAAALKLGIRDYFVKPCDPAELWTSIGAILSVVQPQREQRANALPAALSLAMPGADGVVRRAMRYLQEHCLEPVSLEEVARHVGVGKYTLSREFKQVTNVSLHRYHLQLRIAKATELMFDPRHTITQVAQMVGFHDLPHFDKVFKALVGMIPRAYRASAFRTRARIYKK